jgi:MFS family permease
MAFATGFAPLCHHEFDRIGRAIQGAGAAVARLGLGIARDTLPRDRIARAISVLVGGATVGGAIGFLLSGLLVDQFSPAGIFWFLFVFAVLLSVATVTCVPESPARTGGYVDAAGALLVSGGLLALLLGISQGNNRWWSSGQIIGLFVAAAVAPPPPPPHDARAKALSGIVAAVARKVRARLSLIGAPWVLGCMKPGRQARFSNHRHRRQALTHAHAGRS